MQTDRLSIRHHDPLVTRICCITRYAESDDIDIRYLESLAELVRDIVGGMVETGIDPDAALEEALAQFFPEEEFGDLPEEEFGDGVQEDRQLAKRTENGERPPAATP